MNAAAIAEPKYVLDDQVGFILRQVAQRHTVLFHMVLGGDLTATQWAALAKLFETGPLSQNLLGRHTAMDAATIKGVVDRLIQRGLVATQADPEDGRRLIVDLTTPGRELVVRLTPAAHRLSEVTMAALSAAERDTLLDLLRKLLE